MVNVRGDRGVGDFKNLGHASIIHLNLKNLRVRITFRKFENVLEIGAAPGVDRLRVVAYDHDVAMVVREEIDEIGLDLVRILIFVDQDELKLPPIKRGDALVLLQHRQCLFEQVIEIDRVRGLFLFLVASVNIGDFFEQWQKVRELLGEQFLHRCLGVDHKAENLREHIAFRETNFLWIDPRACDNGVDQIFLIFAVHDGEAAVVSERAAVAAQHPVSDRMKCAAPNSARVDR